MKKVMNEEETSYMQTLKKSGWNYFEKQFA